MAAETIAGMLRYDSRAGGGPMHTLSSARRTCIACSSAVECTATVLMPISRQARWMRSAISPRFAMSTLSNTACALFDDHEDVAVFHGLLVLDHDLAHRAGARRLDLVERLHRLDEHEGLAFLHAVADRNESGRAGLGGEIAGSHHRRFH